jgi:RimJ/RimL family protein N-acetyltransferase
MAKRVVIDQKNRVGAWVYQRVGGMYLPQISQAIGVERDGEIIGGVVFEGWNGASMKIHVAGEGKYWMTREFLRTIFGYAFLQHKAKKLIGVVESTNTKALRFDLKIGFRVEAVIKDAAENGDLLLLTMTKDQCRFI